MPATVGAARIGRTRADVVIGCDMVVAADTPQLAAVVPGRTRVVVNTEETITGAFLADPTLPFPADLLLGAVAARAGAAQVTPADARRLAERLTGEAIAANVLLLGLAWQAGLVPVGEKSLLRAIALNGAGADANRDAFLWGRRAAVDMAVVRRAAGLEESEAPKAPPSLEDVVRVRADHLAGYGGAALARTYKDRVAAVAALSEARAPGRDGLARAVAEGYFHVLAAKDEYEVARLYSDGEFAQAIADAFEGKVRVHYHLAPAWLARPDARTGRITKRSFGPWLAPVFRLLAGFRALRDGPLDPFRRSADRALERRHRAGYEQDLDRIAAALAPATFELLRGACPPAALGPRLRAGPRRRLRGGGDAARDAAGCARDARERTARGGMTRTPRTGRNMGQLRMKPRRSGGAGPDDAAPRGAR